MTTSTRARMTVSEYAEMLAEGIRTGGHDAYSIECSIREAAIVGVDAMIAGYEEENPPEVDSWSEPSTEQRELLESIRRSIEDESVSWGELYVLQNLADFIDDDDVLLLEWAGVPEGTRGAEQ